MADVALEGSIEALLETMPAVEAEDRFAHELRGVRHTDGESGRTARGPHLTDLIVHHRARGRERAPVRRASKRRC